MPLASDRKSKPLPHSNSRSIGFWMAVEGQTPIQPVRVLISYEALSELDPTNVRDLHGAFENFDRFRSRVETAASRSSLSWPVRQIVFWIRSGALWGLDQLTAQQEKAGGRYAAE